MKKYYLSLIFIFFSSSIYAQATIIIDNTGESTGLKPEKKHTIDMAQIRVLYRQMIINDTINNKKTDNIMLLQIGKNIAKFVDYYNFKGDSLIDDHIEKKDNYETIFGETQAYFRGTSSENIFWNYPSNKITVTNFFSGTRYLYEESIPDIKWNLEQGTLTILGYKCKKAKCALFGRNYTVWYTTDIPINKGPWKFSGLPGLILKVIDDKNQISFESISVKNVKWTNPIYIKT